MSSFQFTAYLTVPQPLLAQLESAGSSFQFFPFLGALPDFKRVSPRVIRSPENGRITYLKAFWHLPDWSKAVVCQYLGTCEAGVSSLQIFLSADGF